MRNILLVFADAAMMASATTTSATTQLIGTTTIAGTSTTIGTTVNKTKIIQIPDKREEIKKYNGKGMRGLCVYAIDLNDLIFTSYF